MHSYVPEPARAAGALRDASQSPRGTSSICAMPAVSSPVSLDPTSGFVTVPKPPPRGSIPLVPSTRAATVVSGSERAFPDAASREGRKPRSAFEVFGVFEKLEHRSKSLAHSNGHPLALRAHAASGFAPYGVALELRIHRPNCSLNHSQAQY